MARAGGISGLFVDVNLIPEQVSITVHISYASVVVVVARVDNHYLLLVVVVVVVGIFAG